VQGQGPEVGQERGPEPVLALGQGPGLEPEPVLALGLEPGQELEPDSQ